MKLITSALLVLCVWGDDTKALPQQRERDGTQFSQISETIAHGIDSVAGIQQQSDVIDWNNGSYRVSGTLTSTSTTIELSSGDSTMISSGLFRPRHTGYQEIWNIQATGSIMSVQCWIRFPGSGCGSSSLTIGGNQFCAGSSETIGPITAQDDLQIVYRTRGGRRGFNCSISSPKPEPDRWSETYPACGGSSQSPINIDVTETLGQFPWKELGFHGYDTAPQLMQLINNGRSVVLTTEGPFVMGGNLPLNERYLLQEIVFHWGPTVTTGSEHAFNGQRYAGEIQFVHYNSKYSDYTTALKEVDGLAILSVIAENSPNDNEAFAPVISALRNVQKTGSSIDVEPFPLNNLLPDNDDDFHRYHGSLTNPGCEKTVTWTIFDNTISISSSQLEEFRQLKDEQGTAITSNIRPIQDINGRTVSKGQLTPTWGHYGSDGQDVWATKISPSCGGNKQSPIDIETGSTVTEASWSPLAFTNFDRVPDSMSFQNNDHGAVITPTMDYKATVQGGPFMTPYTFFHYHFHWGSLDSLGSEHTVDGQRYAGEIHMIVYNDSLGGIEQSHDVERGIYEVSVFLQLSSNDNPKLEGVMEGLANIVPSMASTAITPFPLDDLLPDNLQDFYVYDGALTAPEPSCDETAYFILFKDPISISRAQLSKFANLENAAGHKIRNNYRRLQPLNGRTVYTS